MDPASKGDKSALNKGGGGEGGGGKEGEGKRERITNTHTVYNESTCNIMAATGAIGDLAPGRHSGRKGIVLVAFIMSGYTWSC